MDRPPPERPDEPGRDAVHRHRWSAVDFFVHDDRPMMRQRCSCGAERDMPAWDRQWEPPDADPASS